MSKKENINFSLLDLICYPLVTEKTTNVGSSSQVVFIVKKSASKDQIKNAIEHVYKTKVKSVNTLIKKGKKKVFRGKIGHQSDEKKAYVVLEPGQHIDIAAGF